MEIGRLAVCFLDALKLSRSENFDQSCGANLGKIAGFGRLRVSNATANFLSQWTAAMGRRIET